MLFDTHAHFNDDSIQVDGQVSRALAAGVERILAVGGSPAANRAALAVAARFPRHIRAAIGFDRDQSRVLADKKTQDLHKLLFPPGCDRSPIAALGEIGLDFHYAAETEESQRLLFRRQLEIARQLRLPVTVHSREAESATLDELKQHARLWQGVPDRIGVLHCFTGSHAMAEDLLEEGFCLSFSGILTFARADEMRSIASEVPESRLLLETDSPYLAPVPMRGQKNEPGYIRHTAETMAKIRGMTLDALARITFHNACRLFWA